jgi:A/G-specific adenine glycosylase
MTTATAIQQWLRARLLAYYDRHQRDLPWRHTRDPYCIWLSETMLQQTQVATVCARYVLFLKTYPTVHAVAAASEEEICAAFAGLGYYRRAQHLHRAACRVVAQFNGSFPEEAEQLTQLPGIGPYTAGAIASIAFQKPAALVDGNVERVFARFFGLQMPLKTGPGKRHLWALAQACVVGERPGDWNQALMDFGATVCKPKAPACATCVLKARCVAYRLELVERLPVRPAAIVRQKLTIVFAHVVHNTKTWLVRRPLGGLWSGLWELPRLPKIQGQWLGEVRHLLTHREIDAQVVRLARLPAGMSATCTLCSQAETMPLSVLAKKALLLAQKSP